MTTRGIPNCTTDTRVPAKYEYDQPNYRIRNPYVPYAFLSSNTPCSSPSSQISLQICPQKLPYFVSSSRRYLKDLGSLRSTEVDFKKWRTHLTNMGRDMRTATTILKRIIGRAWICWIGLKLFTLFNILWYAYFSLNHATVGMSVYILNSSLECAFPGEFCE